MKLGLSRNLAFQWASTRKGCWRISASPILSRTITNKRLAARGLASAFELYKKR
jgi:hypothetical protein